MHVQFGIAVEHRNQEAIQKRVYRIIFGGWCIFAYMHMAWFLYCQRLYTIHYTYM